MFRTEAQIILPVKTAKTHSRIKRILAVTVVTFFIRRTRWQGNYHHIRYLITEEILNILPKYNDILYSTLEEFEENTSDRFDDTVGKRELIHYREAKR